VRAGSAATSAKVIAPIEIAILPLAARKKDREGERRLEVKVTPRVNAPKLDVTVALPRNVTLGTGELAWGGPAKAGVAQRRELLLKVPRQGEQRVVVTARMVPRPGLRMTRAASFVFNARPEKATPEGALKQPGSIPRIPVTPAPKSQ
jgi:hypothetical protein